MSNSNDRITELILRIEKDYPDGVGNNTMKPISLWHYTSLDGLKGIIQKNKLKFWFTRSDCLNDIKEGNEAFLVFKEIREQWKNDDKVDKEFVELLDQIEMSGKKVLFLRENQDEINVKLSEYDAYICSFSKKDDLLEMWRYYSKGKGGYSLQFDKALFDEIKNNFLYGDGTTQTYPDVYNVIYNKKKQKELFEEKIRACHDLFLFSKDSNIVNKQYIKQTIETILNKYRFRFKNQCFSNEQEIRAVICLPKGYSDTNNHIMLKYRESHEIMIPYLELSISNNDLLKQIKISPFIKNDVAVETTSLYLNSMGYDAKVKQSTLPVRF